MASRCGRKVLEAVRTLGEPRGCTMAEVVKYVRQHCQPTLSAVRCHVLRALERFAARGLVRRVSRRYAATRGGRRRRSRSPRRRWSATKTSPPRGSRTCPRSPPTAPRGRPPTRRTESSGRKPAKRNRKSRKRSPAREETRGESRKTAEVEEGPKEERHHRQAEECDCEEVDVLEKLLQGTRDADVSDCRETTQEENAPPEKQNVQERTSQEMRDALTLATTCPRCCCKLIVRVKKTAT